MALVDNDRDAVTAILQQQQQQQQQHQQQLQQQQQGGTGVRNGGAVPEEVGPRAAFPGAVAAMEAEDHQRKENSRGGGLAVAPGPMPDPQSLLAPQHVARHESCVGATAPEGVGVEPMPLDKKATQLKGAVPTNVVVPEGRTAPAVGSDLPGQAGLGASPPVLSYKCILVCCRESAHTVAATSVADTVCNESIQNANR